MSASTDAPVTRNIAYHAAYTTKAALLADLERANQGGSVKIHEIVERLGNSDTSTWADKGSQGNN